MRLFEPQFLASIARHYKIRIWPGTTEKVGAKGEVTSSNQDGKNKVATLVCSKWVFGKVFAVFFLRMLSKFELNSSMTKVCQLCRCVVQDCNNGSNPRQGISFHILLQAAMFYQVQTCQPSRFFVTSPGLPTRY